MNQCCSCSDRSAVEPIAACSAKANAIAGANRRRNQPTAAELEQHESSSCTSDESSDDQMDAEPTESEVVGFPAADGGSDGVCDIKTNSVSVDLSVASHKVDTVVENLAEQNVEPVTVRQTAVHIAVHRTDKIQVFSVFFGRGNING